MYIYIFSFSLLLLIYSSLFPIVPGLFLNTCSNIRGAESITCRPIHWSQDRSSSSLLATMLEDSRSPPSPPPTMSGGLDWGPFGTNIPKAEREKGRGGRASLFSRTRSHGPRALVTRSVTQTFCSLLTFGLYISRVCIHSHSLSPSSFHCYTRQRVCIFPAGCSRIQIYTGSDFTGKSVKKGGSDY